MEININKEYLSIKEFSIDNLPDFIVITGENGTGKTQLLYYLHASSGMEMNPEINDQLPFPTLEYNEEGNLKEGAKIFDKGKELRNIYYQEVHAPIINLGEDYKIDDLIQKGSNLTLKHTFYRTQLLWGEDVSNIIKLGQDYEKANNYKPSDKSFTGHNGTFSKFTKSDYDLIKKIEAEHPNDDITKDVFYYIVYHPVPATNVFSSNLKFLFMQYWARIQAGMPRGNTPWETFNNIANRAGFKYNLVEPKLAEKKFDVKLRDKKTGTFVSPKTLSSGEKVILSLVLAMYTSETPAQLPEVILLDEPDAYLHPSFSKIMLDVIQDILVKQHGIKVIITTHSPSTVSLAPSTSLYKMEDGKMMKTTKTSAIKSLTEGINTLVINYENVKQIFVEADNDNLYLSKVYQIAQLNNWLNKDIPLYFINAGNTSNGGCVLAKKIVDDMRNAHNESVFAMLDSDGGNNKETGYIKILGCGTRYAIENYVVDPASMLILFLLENASVKQSIGFSEMDSIISFLNKSHDEKQALINNYVARVYASIPKKNPPVDTSIVQYKTMEGDIYEVPKWYFDMKGHDLVEYIRQAFPFMAKYKGDKALFQAIIEKVYTNFPGLIPSDIIESLKIIQDSSM